MMTISKILAPLLLATAGLMSATSYAGAVEAQAKSTVNVRHNWWQPLKPSPA